LIPKQAKPLKSDLQDMVNDLQQKLEKATLEAQRQKEKKKREKERNKTLSELAAAQMKEPHPVQNEPPKNQPKQVAFNTVENPKPVEPPNPRDDPRVKRLMAQGATFRTAVAMAGLRV
jgi:hypothetical protein